MAANSPATFSASVAQLTTNLSVAAAVAATLSWIPLLVAHTTHPSLPSGILSISCLGLWGCITHLSFHEDFKKNALILHKRYRTNERITFIKATPNRILFALQLVAAALAVLTWYLLDDEPIRLWANIAVVVSASALAMTLAGRPVGFLAIGSPMRIRRGAQMVSNITTLSLIFIGVLWMIMIYPVWTLSSFRYAAIGCAFMSVIFDVASWVSYCEKGSVILVNWRGQYEVTDQHVSRHLNLDLPLFRRGLRSALVGIVMSVIFSIAMAICVPAEYSIRIILFLAPQLVALAAIFGAKLVIARAALIRSRLGGSAGTAAGRITVARWGQSS